MKKMLRIASTLLLVILAMGLVSCGDGVDEKTPEGWIDENTFRAQATGYAPEGETRKWKALSKMAAEIEVAEVMMRKMVGSFIESTQATEDAELIGRVVKMKAKGDIVGYVIINADYDENAMSCTVTAELQQEGLKQTMDERIKQYFEELKNAGVGPMEEGEGEGE